MEISGNYNRNTTLDAIKAFAIICVIFGHCIQFGSGADFLSSEAFFENPIFKTIYSFHMPLFMLISGYLFAHSVGKNRWYNVIFKKFRTLIIPILCWSILVYLKHSYSTLKSDASLFGVLKGYLNTCASQLWFLWAVFYCSSTVAIIKRFFCDNKIIYIALWIGTFFIPDNYVPAVYKYMYPYFVIGYFCGKSQDIISAALLKNKKCIVGVLTVVFIGLLFLYSTDSFVYTSGYGIIRNREVSFSQLVIDIYRFIIGLSGSALVIILFKIATPFFNKHKKPIYIIGSNTMGLYIISGYLNSNLLEKVTSELTGLNIAYTIIESAIILTLSIALCFIIKKYKLPRKVLLGDIS